MVLPHVHAHVNCDGMVIPHTCFKWDGHSSHCLRWDGHSPRNKKNLVEDLRWNGHSPRIDSVVYVHPVGVFVVPWSLTIWGLVDPLLVDPLKSIEEWRLWRFVGKLWRFVGKLVYSPTWGGVLESMKISNIYYCVLWKSFVYLSHYCELYY